MEKICVYCGSSSGVHPAYAEAAKGLGKALVGQGLQLVYGGASIGLMGLLADAVLDHGGEVIGVMPRSLAQHEVGHPNLSQFHLTETMHERKAKMAELADGFIALPGGLGTLEEIFEILTWGQLAFHQKPCGLLNVQGYFDPLLEFLDGAVQEGFVKAEHRKMLLVESCTDGLLNGFVEYQAPQVGKLEE